MKLPCFLSTIAVVFWAPLQFLVYFMPPSSPFCPAKLNTPTSIDPTF